MDGGCVTPLCPGQECSAREGFRQAVDLVREAVKDGEAAEWLPARMCLEATALVPDWELTGPDYQPEPEQWLSPDQLEQLGRHGLVDEGGIGDDHDDASYG